MRFESIPNGRQLNDILIIINNNNKINHAILRHTYRPHDTPMCRGTPVGKRCYRYCFRLHNNTKKL